MPYTPIIPNHRSRFGFTVSGPVVPEDSGGKTYLSLTMRASVFRVRNFRESLPHAAMRAGVIQVPDSTGAYIPYNLNPFPVTVVVGNSAVNVPNSGTRLCTLAAYGSTCGGAAGAALDPRNSG